MRLTSAPVTSGHQERDVCRVSGSLEGPRPVSRTSGRGRSPSPSLRTRRGRALRAVSCQTNVSQELASERPSVNVPSVLALPVRSGFEGCQRRSCRSYSSGADEHHKYARFEQVLKSTDIIPIFLSALTRAPPPFFFCGELSSAVGDGSEVFL